MGEYKSEPRVELSLKASLHRFIGKKRRDFGLRTALCVCSPQSSQALSQAYILMTWPQTDYHLGTHSHNNIVNPWHKIQGESMEPLFTPSFSLLPSLWRRENSGRNICPIQQGCRKFSTEFPQNLKKLFKIKVSTLEIKKVKITKILFMKT